MDFTALEEFLSYIKARTYNLQSRKHYDITISVFFFKDGQRNILFENRNRKILSRVQDEAELQLPEKITIEIVHSKGTESHSHGHTKTYEKTRNSDENSRRTNENNPINGFGGLTNVNTNTIEAIVNKRLEEERKKRELNELQTKLIENTQTLSEKESEIKGLKEEVESKKEEIFRLEKSLKDKKKFKYYAGITGDILQSFGLDKKIIAKPLAGLLTNGDEEAESKAIEQTASDTSGIVDENEPKTKNRRQEMIDLLSMYIKNLDTSTLEKLFNIFSEIENNPNNADKIIQFLNNK